MISYGIQRLTGKTEVQGTKERLFDPLEIQDYYWDFDPSGAIMGAHAMHLKVRDLTKIGQMVLDHSCSNGSQIVDSTWISLAKQKQVEVPN